MSSNVDAKQIRSVKRDYTDPKIQELKDFLYKKKLGVWTIKDILQKVMDLYDNDDKRG